MKLSIERNELQHGLSRIQAIVEKRNSMPILSNVRLEAAKSGKQTVLRLAATDLEVGIHSTHTAEVEKTGGVTVSAKKLYEITRELQEEKIRLNTTENQFLELDCARSHFTLAGTAVEEYPTLPGATPKKLITMSAVVLSSMIERTMYAASVDETRYNLNGVFLELLPEGGKLRMVATDGHRLAYADQELGEAAADLPGGVILPRKGLAELKRLVDEEDANEIAIGFEGNSGLVRKGDVTLVMRLIEGEFPNYRQVIPKDPGRRLVLTSGDLIPALRRVHLLASQQSHAVRLEFSAGRVAVSTSNPDLGEAREELDVDYAGDEVAIGFNARYLIDALAAMGSKEVELAFRDELSPVQIAPAGEADTLSVVMPMRL